VTVWAGRGDAPGTDALLAAIASTDVLLSLLTERVDAELLAAAPQLLGVANHAAGHDNVDLAAATRLGIPVSNTPDVLTETTADLAWALLLGAGRRIVEADRFAAARRWASSVSVASARPSLAGREGST